MLEGGGKIAGGGAMIYEKWLLGMLRRLMLHRHKQNHSIALCHSGASVDATMYENLTYA
jgi:hypothetical protein